MDDEQIELEKWGLYCTLQAHYKITLDKRGASNSANRVRLTFSEALADRIIDSLMAQKRHRFGNQFTIDFGINTLEKMETES